METIGIVFLSISCLILIKLINDLEKRVNKLETACLLINHTLSERIRKITEKGGKKMDLNEETELLISNLKFIKQNAPQTFEKEFQRAIFELPADIRSYVEKRVNEDE